MRKIALLGNAPAPALSRFLDDIAPHGSRLFLLLPEPTESPPLHETSPHAFIDTERYRKARNGSFFSLSLLRLLREYSFDLLYVPTTKEELPHLKRAFKLFAAMRAFKKTVVLFVCFHDDGTEIIGLQRATDPLNRATLAAFFLLGLFEAISGSVWGEGGTLLFGAWLCAVEGILRVGQGKKRCRSDDTEEPEGETKRKIRYERGAWEYLPDTVLGWIHAPGTIAHHYWEKEGVQREWRATITKEGCRLTRPENTVTTSENLPLVGIFGCSYTFGVGLSDCESFPYALQEALPDYRVDNYGVAGYSTYQAFLRLKRLVEVEKRRPALAVFCIAPFHEVRNVNSLDWQLRATLLSGMFAPYARLSRETLKEFPPGGYERVFLSSKLRLVECLEYGINRLLLGNPPRSSQQKGAEAILKKIQEYCGSRNIPLLIAEILADRDYEAFLKREGFYWCRLGPTIQDYLVKGWSLAPLDSHPNPEMAKIYATHLADALRKSKNGALPQGGGFEATFPPSPSRKTDQKSEDEIFSIYPLF